MVKCLFSDTFGTAIGKTATNPTIMKSKLLLPIALLFTAFVLKAQPVPVGHLTIFSEDGDKFFLILNGEKQNNVAQTNLRVEDLTQDYYNAKVIFEDQALGEISKNYLPITDPSSGLRMDVTYKIKKNKNNGKMSLNYFSAIPVSQNWVNPGNVYVTRWGSPAPPPTTTVVTTGTPSGTVTQQTTTTTTTTGGNVGGVNMNVGGVNVGVTVTDPVLTGSTTTTHTTTTTTSGGTTVYEQPVPTQPVGCVNAYPMNGGNFSNAIATIKNQSFEEGKLKTAKQVAGSNCLSTSQIAEVCKCFGFEESKLDFAKFAYDHCTEPGNYWNINNVFSFSSSSDELNDYVQSRH